MLHQFLQVLIKALTDNATVKGYVGMNIYPKHISQMYDIDKENKTKVDFPCITLIVENPQPAGGKLKEISTATVEIKTHAEVQKTANQIYDAAKEVLFSKRLSDTNYYVTTGELPDLPYTMSDPDSEPKTYNAYAYFDITAIRRT